MGNKIFMILMHVMIFLGIHAMCKVCSCYFEELKINKYIVIKNKIFARILIAEYAERNKQVKSYDGDKMSITGLIAYGAILPFNLLNMILDIIAQVNPGIINNINQNSLFKNVSKILILLVIINLITQKINLKDCE